MVIVNKGLPIWAWEISYTSVLATHFNYDNMPLDDTYSEMSEHNHSEK